MLVNFRLVVSLTEAFLPMWPDWAGLGCEQDGVWGGIGELSQAGAVPSELTASRSHGCLSQTPAFQPGPVVRTGCSACTVGYSACPDDLLLSNLVLHPPPPPSPSDSFGKPYN